MAAKLPGAEGQLGQFPGEARLLSTVSLQETSKGKVILPNLWESY